MTIFSERWPLTLFVYHKTNISITFFSDTIWYLSFTLICTSCTNKHMLEICCKSLKVLESTKRMLREMHIFTHLKAMYNAIVYPILEYGMVLWNPSSAASSNMFERVCKKYHQSIAFACNILCSLHGYTPVRLLLLLLHLLLLDMRLIYSFFQTFLLTKSIIHLFYH